MKIPALKQEDTNTVRWIDVDSDLLLMTMRMGDIVIETVDGTFVLPSTLQEWASVLRPHNCEMTDRNCIVKLDRIVERDARRKRIYLKQHAPDRRISATVARARWAGIENRLQAQRK